jgi:hypothetical protein
LQAGDYWCLNRHISLGFDFGYSRRQEGRELHLVEDAAKLIKNKPKKVIDAGDLVENFDWQPTLRGRLLLHPSACSTLEGLYTYYYPWTGKEERKADGSLQFPFIDPTITNDFFEADIADTKYKSWLQNGEVNRWRHLTPQRINYFSFSWLLGFRTMFLKETLDVWFTKGEDRSLYGIETRNRLYGLQLGAMLEVNPNLCWTWTFMLKGAGFFNNAENELAIGDLNNEIVFRDYKKERLYSSWLLEGYAQLAYHLSSSMSIHIAYQGFILSGLAIAPNQRDTKTTERRRINGQGQIVIDGGFVGITFGF